MDKRMNTAELAEARDGVARLIEAGIAGTLDLAQPVLTTMLVAQRRCIAELDERWSEEK